MEKQSGRVEAIWLKRMVRGPMDPVSKIELKNNRGIVSNADQGGKRQVTIIEKEIWDWMMSQLGADLPPHTRRANLMVSRFPLKDSRGKIVQIGEVQIQIMGETKPCERMEQACKGLRDLMYPEWRGGAYGVVLNDGRIGIGDEVSWVE